MHSILLLMYLGLGSNFLGNVLKFLARYQAAWVQTMSSVYSWPIHCCVGLEACISDFWVMPQVLGSAGTNARSETWAEAASQPGSQRCAVPGLCHAAVCPPWDSQEPPPLSPTPRARDRAALETEHWDGRGSDRPWAAFLFAAPNRDLPTFIFRFLQLLLHSTQSFCCNQQGERGYGSITLPRQSRNSISFLLKIKSLCLSSWKPEWRSLINCHREQHACVVRLTVAAVGQPCFTCMQCPAKKNSHR